MLGTDPNVRSFSVPFKLPQNCTQGFNASTSLTTASFHAQIKKKFMTRDPQTKNLLL